MCFLIVMCVPIIVVFRLSSVLIYFILHQSFSVAHSPSLSPPPVLHRSHSIAHFSSLILHRLFSIAPSSSLVLRFPFFTALFPSRALHRPFSVSPSSPPNLHHSFFIAQPSSLNLFRSFLVVPLFPSPSFHRPAPLLLKNFCKSTPSKSFIPSKCDEKICIWFSKVLKLPQKPLFRDEITAYYLFIPQSCDEK